MKPLTRDSYWLANLDGNNKKIKVKNLSDTHVANIVDWITNVKHYLKPNYPKSYTDFFIRELNYRGLSSDFLSKAPYDYENDYEFVYGEWMVIKK